MAAKAASGQKYTGCPAPAQMPGSVFIYRPTPQHQVRPQCQYDQKDNQHLYKVRGIGGLSLRLSFFLLQLFFFLFTF